MPSLCFKKLDTALVGPAGERLCQQLPCRLNAQLLDAHLSSSNLRHIAGQKVVGQKFDFIFQVDLLDYAS